MRSFFPKPRLIQWSKGLEGLQIRESKHDPLHSIQTSNRLSNDNPPPIWQRGMLEESKVGDTKQQSEATWIPMKRIMIKLSFHVVEI